jgi:ribonucleotide monophosphatase NagD (HAD superfamily)
VTLADAARKISLLLADVDGTLVTHDKMLTERARRAVHKLHDRGIRFAITSGRPPKGMAMLIAPLETSTSRSWRSSGFFLSSNKSSNRRTSKTVAVGEHGSASRCRHSHVLSCEPNAGRISLDADALSTAFSLMPLDDAAKVVKERRVRAYLTLPDGVSLSWG